MWLMYVVDASTYQHQKLGFKYFDASDADALILMSMLERCNFFPFFRAGGSPQALRLVRQLAEKLQLDVASCSTEEILQVPSSLLQLVPLLACGVKQCGMCGFSFCSRKGQASPPLKEASPPSPVWMQWNKHSGLCQT